MHGIIHSELRKFVVEKYGPETWDAILANAGMEHRYFLVSQTYPDDETIAIVKSASEISNLPIDTILEAFGFYIVPALVRLYGAFIRAEWRTEELLLNTEETIHRVVRMKNPGAEPPQLKIWRKEPGLLHFHYNSPRQMSALAKGIVKAVANYYHEAVQIEEFPQDDGSVLMHLHIGQATA